MKQKWYDNKAIVVALLIFFSPVGLFGLWKSDKFGKTGKIVWSALCALMFLGIMVGPKPSPPVVLEKTLVAYDKASESELPITYSEFEENFNAFGKSFTPAIRLYPAKLNPKNKGDKFATRQAIVTDNIILTATEADSGRVGGVIMLGRGDGEFESGMAIIMAMGAIMSGIDKNITSEQRGDVLKGLGVVGSGGLESDKPAATVMRGIKYSVANTPGVGLLFSAEKNI